MQILRDRLNPLIKPIDVVPIDSRMKIIGVFNPGVTTLNGDVLLLLRVAVVVDNNDKNKLCVPIYDENNNKIDIFEYDKGRKDIDFRDSRFIIDSYGNRYLTSLSYFLVATSKDGQKFKINYDKIITPSTKYHSYGIEDARIVKIGDIYYINFSSASQYGIVTSMITTKDFKSYTDLGNIFYSDNKDVSLFPEQINGKYYALHRPSISEFAKPNMWIAESDNITCWGNHKCVMTVRGDKWDSARIGSSSAPIKTPYGWFVIYHGANSNNEYRLGAVLLDLEQPWRVLKRSDMPFMEPQCDYEKKGFFSNVVFSCGCNYDSVTDNICIYYGAADYCICKADVKMADILATLKEV